MVALVMKISLILTVFLAALTCACQVPYRDTSDYRSAYTDALGHLNDEYTRGEIGWAEYQEKIGDLKLKGGQEPTKHENWMSGSL
ncbi:MAG TPA: hypothetical protein VGM54_13460 [Chthoniobacter sp.]|jgi:hypothetical protein